jgi:hypothetical protein
MSSIKVDPVQQLLHTLEKEADSQDIICCRLCNTPITSRPEQIKIGLSHRHHFTNPAGITYGIACYQSAAGCSISEQPTKEHSWFGGYHWQMAHCTECNEHLGWYYENKKNRFFFGLIVDRLKDISA